MKKVSIFLWLAAIVVIGAVCIPIYILLQRAASSLSSIEIVIVLIYPVLASAAASFVVTYFFRRTDRSHWQNFDTRLATLAHRKVNCLGTKYEVPSGGDFWNALLFVAKRRFFLIGNTNKSWIWKDEAQAKRLAESIYEIVSNGGEVRIVSNNDASTISKTKKFVETHLKPLVKRKSIVELFNRNFSYSTVQKSNYSGVVSDDRLLLMPVMNTNSFRAESMVLDLNIFDHAAEFKNYLGDIGRITGPDGEGNLIALGW